jgi:hypothetical protein
LAKLRDYLIEAGIVTAVSRETLRRILHEGGTSWQATKTWKASNDPDFHTKLRRILDLYDHPPADGRVICVDEFGPLIEPATPTRTRLAASRAAASAARHLHPHPRGTAHDRRPGPSQRQAVLPHPRP